MPHVPHSDCQLARQAAKHVDLQHSAHPSLPQQMTLQQVAYTDFRNYIVFEA